MILASASPRRKQLLSEAGYKFVVIPADVDESSFSIANVTADEYAKKLALAKAENVAQKYPDSLVAGFDTVVDCEGQIVGKPANARQARLIIERLFGRPHKVITAVAIVRLSDNVRMVESDTTEVYPRKMSKRQINEHIKSGLWKDKAGAYAIRQGSDEFIERIEGSPTNVMGMPMELLRKMLKKFVPPPCRSRM